MRKCIILLTFYLVGCSRFDGIVEKRDSYCLPYFKSSKSVYLLNTSSHKKYKYTLEVATILNDSINKYENYFYILEPGESKYLGCDLLLSDVKFEKKLSIKAYPLNEIYVSWPDSSWGKIDIGDYENARVGGAKLEKKLSINYALPLEISELFDTSIDQHIKLFSRIYENDSSKLVSYNLLKREFKITGQQLFKGN